MSNPAEGYESYMVPALFGPWASNLVETADPDPREPVLDLACGTGIVARRVASQLGGKGTITGVDISPNMLAVARAAATREGATIEWHEGHAGELPFPDASFRLVLCGFALMSFCDRPAALSEARRVLMRGGRFLLSVWQGLDRHPFYQRLDEVIQHHLGKSAVADIFSLGDPRELRSLLTEAGFQRVQIDPVSMTSRFPNPEAFLAGEIEVDTAAIPSMQHLTIDERHAIVAAISEDMRAPLHEVTREDHVVLEFHVSIARAWR